MWSGVECDVRHRHDFPVSPLRCRPVEHIWLPKTTDVTRGFLSRAFSQWSSDLCLQSQLLRAVNSNSIACMRSVMRCTVSSMVQPPRHRYHQSGVCVGQRVSRETARTPVVQSSRHPQLSLKSVTLENPRFVQQCAQHARRRTYGRVCALVVWRSCVAHCSFFCETGFALRGCPCRQRQLSAQVALLLLAHKSTSERLVGEVVDTHETQNTSAPHRHVHCTLLCSHVHPNRLCVHVHIYVFTRACVRGGRTSCCKRVCVPVFVLLRGGSARQDPRTHEWRRRVGLSPLKKSFSGP